MFSFCPLVQAGSNPIYNVKTQPDSSSSASVPVAVTSHQHSVSERAECRFFMNTGTCKYGDDCKYTHPRERMLPPPPPNLLNPNVLPARPVSSSLVFLRFFTAKHLVILIILLFAVFRGNQHVVTLPPDSASMEQTANLLTQCH